MNEYLALVALVVALVGIGYTAFMVRQLRKEIRSVAASMPSRRVTPQTRK